MYFTFNRSEESYKTYTDTMPWLSIPFAQEDRRQKLAQALDVQAIPTLVILDPRDNIITLEGRTELLEDPEGLVSLYFIYYKVLFFFPFAIFYSLFLTIICIYIYILLCVPVISGIFYIFTFICFLEKRQPSQIEMYILYRMWLYAEGCALFFFFFKNLHLIYHGIKLSTANCVFRKCLRRLLFLFFFFKATMRNAVEGLSRGFSHFECSNDIVNVLLNCICVLLGADDLFFKC